MNVRTHGASRALIALALTLALPNIARADFVKDSRGHFSIGYSRLGVANAPGGSISMGAGLEHHVSGPLSAGIDLDYYLLGSRTLNHGSLVASLDYSWIEAVLFTHWALPGLGPVARISVGPAIVSARAQLSSSGGGGAAFSESAVEEVVPGAAFEATLMQRALKPVRVGLELSGRVAYVPGDRWSLGSIRLAFHY